MVTKIKDVISEIEKMAPRDFQESWDNSGVQVGDVDQKVSGVLLCTDITEATIKEALSKKANLIISHHPLLFNGLKSLTGKSYVERVVIDAVKSDIVIYSAHTNMDKCLGGVSYKMAEKLGLTNLSVMDAEKNWLFKIVTYVPEEKADAVKQAMWNAGAGCIGNYDKCSYNIKGEGTFKAQEGCNPYVGEIGELHREKEVRVALIVPRHKLGPVVMALKDAHPYEEPAIDIVKLENRYEQMGLGCIGELPEAMSCDELLGKIKEAFNVECIRHTSDIGKLIKRIALCGGSGAEFIELAKQRGADMYVTADIKYHEFFAAENQIVIADIGHFESEQYTKEIFYEQLSKKFINFAILIAESDKSPVLYS